MISKCCCRSFKELGARCLPFVVLLAVLALLAPQAALAQGLFHGIGVQKNCTNPKQVGQATDCSIRAVNNSDDAGDTLVVQGMWDIVQASPADVRVPAMGNLPITATAGGAVCAAGPTFPCSLPVGASVTVRSNAYVIDGDDPNPLPDQGQIQWNDTCNGTPDVGCNTQTNTANAPAQTVIVECVTDEDCGPDPGVCGNNACVENECQFVPEPATTICRASGGICDVEESCDGTNPECPADQKEPATTICRASGGVCDVEESCDGTTNECPADQKEPATTICRASGGVCDVEESCDGTNPECPADEFLPATTSCNAELCQSCTGNTASCPETNLCNPEACRTPGYWAQHAGEEKENSTNQTSNVIASVGTITVCGQTINPFTGPGNTGVDHMTSPIEALCMPNKGDYRSQVIFHLTAAKLNCAANGFPDCVGSPLFGDAVADCESDGDVCAVTTDATKPAQTACVQRLDCLNNGGVPGPDGFCGNGTCSDNGEACKADALSLCGDPATAVCNPASNCHQLNFPNFPDSPAGSQKACQEASKNECSIFGGCAFNP